MRRKTHHEAKVICKAVQHETHSCANKETLETQTFSNLAKLKKNLAYLLDRQRRYTQIH